MLILVSATLLANFVAGIIVRGATDTSIAGRVAPYGIIVFAVLAALTQMGIAEKLIAPTFLIDPARVALAATLAFGLGAQSVAQRLVEQDYRKSYEARQQIQQDGSSEGPFTTVNSGDRSDARRLDR